MQMEICLVGFAAMLENIGFIAYFKHPDAFDYLQNDFATQNTYLSQCSQGFTGMGFGYRFSGRRWKQNLLSLQLP